MVSHLFNVALVENQFLTPGALLFDGLYDVGKTV